MKRMRLAILLLAGMAVTGSPVIASFDYQQGGARSGGLGGAFTGLSDTSESIFYNAAGLAQLERGEFAGTYSGMYLGLDDGSTLSNGNLSVAWPLGKGSANKGVAGFGMGSFALSGYYSETVFGAYYSRQLSRLIAVGGGLKYLSIGYGKDEYTNINPVFHDRTGKGNISTDVGMMMYPLKDLSVGASMRDINGPDMGLRFEDRVGQTMTLGAAYRFKETNILSDVQMQRGNFKFLVGGERWFMARQLGVRAGIGIGSRNYASFSTGLSYWKDHVCMDYSLNYPLSGISGTYGTHRLSFGYKFEQAMPVVVKDDSEELARQEARSLYEQAVRAIEGGEYISGIDMVSRATVLDKKNRKYIDVKERLVFTAEYLPAATGKSKADALLRKGVGAFVVDDEAKQAADMLLYAYSLNPDREEVHDLIKAIARERKIEVDKLLKGWNLVDQKLYLALESFKQKKYYECIKKCEEVLVLEPENVVACKRLGSAYYVLKNNVKAREYWRKAVQLDPNGEGVDRIRKLLEEMQ